jgi:uncharacterized protein YqeY
MTTLKEKIVADMTTAMKEKNTIARDTLRVIKGEIERNEQTKDGKIELTDGDVIKLIKKSIEGIKETTNNAAEIAVLESYLPKQLNETEIETIVLDLLKAGTQPTIKDLMRDFNAKHNGQADGKILVDVIKRGISAMTGEPSYDVRK